MNEESIFELLAGYAREVVPELASVPITRSDSLKELGANSMDRADIIMMTLETLSLRTPLREFAAARNLGELAATIHAQVAAR